MKNVIIITVFALLLLLFIKLYESFYKGGLEYREKVYHIELLTSEGGTPIIVPQKVKSSDIVTDSILIYHTSCDITKNELKALAFLTQYYDITLNTE